MGQPCSFEQCLFACRFTGGVIFRAGCKWSEKIGLGGLFYVNPCCSREVFQPGQRRTVIDHPLVFGGKLSSTSDERKAIQSAVESYYALPGVPDSEPLGHVRVFTLKNLQSAADQKLLVVLFGPVMSGVILSFLLRLESVDLQDFFNNNGVLIADSPQNWVLLASLGRPLSRSFGQGLLMDLTKIFPTSMKGTGTYSHTDL